MQGDQHAPAPPQGKSRGYFAIGVERISKQLNFGNMVRSAHGFGASFVFTVGADYKAIEARADTSKALRHMPLYHWETPGDMALPRACKLVGVELIEDALDLPSFRHPLQAAYILGPERGELSPEILDACDHLVKIPTAFCINVAMAGAIVMYDRACTLGRFSPRSPGGGVTARKARPVHGAPKSRQATRR